MAISICSVVVACSNINNPSFPFKFPTLWPSTQKLKMGSLTVSPMGFGTWAWGNQFLWGYRQSMDDDLQRIFNFALHNGVNLFDTADSYGTGRFNGQSEKLLGRFIRDFQGSFFTLSLSHFHLTCSPNCLFTSSEKKGSRRQNIVIATKFAAYPWRLTPGQFVNACRLLFLCCYVPILHQWLY